VTLKARYFRVGLFVLTGMALIVAAVIAFGMGALTREEHFYAETYFQESVQGLEVGSPVKHLGVEIGRVELITFADQVYDIEMTNGYKRPVLVRSALFPSALHVPSNKSFEELVPEMVKAGMRIRLATQGLTGVRYLESVLLDPERYPPMEITWNSKELYVPSARTQMSAIVDSIDTLTQRLAAIPFEELTDGVDALVQTVRGAVSDADIAGLSDRTKRLLDNLNGTTGPRLTEMTARVDRLLDRLNVIAADIDVAGTMNDLDATMAALRDTTAELPETVRQIDRLLEDLEAMMGSEGDTVRLMLRDLRQATSNLRDFTETLKRYPSAVIFGKEPPPSDPEGKREGGKP
jgi:ABC-type transporter Mla subunit MlaD